MKEGRKERVFSIFWFNYHFIFYIHLYILLSYISCNILVVKRI